MPLYDYRCDSCQQTFSVKLGFDDPAPPCPHCAADRVHRVILTAPRQLLGIEANAGDSRRSSKEQLRDKWAEETPKLRKKLVDKLGEEVVNRNAPTLNHDYNS